MLGILTLIIIFVAVTNLIRMTVYLVGADIHLINHARRRRGDFTPSVSVIVPAHNEEYLIARTLENLLAVDYEPLEVIVVDDGSTDHTMWEIAGFKYDHDPDNRIKVLTKANGGKADALNEGLANATGELVMCLDGDSLLEPDAVRRSVDRFRDPRVIGTATNVNILPNRTLLGLIQRFEYLISYHMKKAHNTYNIEYIIGGIGSMFRRSVLDEVGRYDTNTMTEDIDLSMKLLNRVGNRRWRLEYAGDAVTWTEAVPTFRCLVRQRYRWKYGRLQTFWKNRALFFSTDKRHGRLLSWVMLPHALAQEMFYLIEPILVATIVGTALYFHELRILGAAWLVITVYIMFNILGTQHMRLRQRLWLLLLSPLMYFMLFVLGVVEYLALIKSIVNLPRLKASLKDGNTTWKSPQRTKE